MSPIPQNSRTILVTGASGYVGGRLLMALSERGERLRAMARNPESLRARLAAQPGTLTRRAIETVRGDLLDEGSLKEAMHGVHTAFYLVHSMGDGDDFAARELMGARNFLRAAELAGVRRVIYLGGLLSTEGELSEHLRSRRDVGQILRGSTIETIELRASIVIGAGSLSFEMVRALVERLPVMITPRWVDVQAQPIAVDDLISYLIESLDLAPGISRIYEIGGSERVSYGELMRAYARERGLRRLMLRVPVLTPRLSSLWLGLVTPLYARVGRKLIESIRHPTVVNDPRTGEAFRTRPRDVQRSIAAALQVEDQARWLSRWCDAQSASTSQPTFGGVRFGNRLVDSRLGSVAAGPGETFAAVNRIGGKHGWYAFNFLWTLRGWLDLLLGGVGMRRGRRDPDHLVVGDVLDCWRVEAIEPARLLRLRAEMKLPGRAWLEFEVTPSQSGSNLRQTATFDPVGLLGLLYWYGIWPLHSLVFAGMLSGLVRAAERKGSEEHATLRRPAA